MLPVLTKLVTSRRLELGFPFCATLRCSIEDSRLQPHLQLYLDLNGGRRGRRGEERGAVSFLGKKEGTVMS